MCFSTRVDVKKKTHFQSQDFKIAPKISAPECDTHPETKQNNISLIYIMAMLQSAVKASTL